MTEPVPVYLGSVNRWECDENDHLNVRFFAQKMHQTLETGLSELGLSTPTAAHELTLDVTSQHMRYVAEARIATPITGSIGILSISDQQIKLVTLLRNTTNQQLLASYVHTVAYSGAVNQDVIELPEQSGSRGLAAETLPYVDHDIGMLQAAGFVTIGRGCITPDECSADGWLLPWLYMGRCSDSMPNLWAKFATGSEYTRGNGLLGGAVLEYRMTFHTRLKAGDRFEVLSGLRSLGEKTQHMAHIMVNIDTGETVVGCEAIGITMDLVKRKSIPIPAERRQVMERFILSDPGANQG